MRMHRIVTPTGRRFPLMSDRSALCSLHASLVKDMKYIRLRDRYPDLIHYPPPPVPGTEIIVPITSAEELVREGHEQENCVTSYFPDIAIVQTHYVYRVFQPERCTLSLQKTDDEWHPSQLAGKQNREASKETWQVVNDWFAAATGSQQDIDPHSDPDS